MRDRALETDRETETVIHPTALVDPGAELGQGVTVGPWSIIGSHVRIGDGTEIGSHVLVEKDTQVGALCRIFKGAVLGTDPQDLKYAGEPTELRIGDRTVVREYATLHRGTAARGVTSVGDDCYLMAYVHVAHDCVLGNHVILSNAVNMAGHVLIEDWASVGGLTPIHQFVRIGAHAFVGGATRTSQDVPPYCKAAGTPMKLFGLNTVGLERRGFSPELRKALKQAYRLVFGSKLTLSERLRRAEEEVPSFPEVKHFLTFIGESPRGVGF